MVTSLCVRQKTNRESFALKIVLNTKDFFRDRDRDRDVVYPYVNGCIFYLIHPFSVYCTLIAAWRCNPSRIPSLRDCLLCIGVY